MAELLAAFTYIPQQRWGPVSPHGVGTALGFFLGAWLMARRAEPRGIPRSEVYNAVTWGALGAIIGARGFYVLAHLDTYRSVVDALKVWEGGLTMFGGFVGGLALGLGYLRRKNFHIPTALDAAAPGFVVGVLIGRLGDIAIADHLGERTNLPFGYEIPNAPLAPGYGPPYYTPGAIVHHTAVYDFLGAFVLLGFLYWLGKRKPRTGTLFATFSIWYGLQRFLIDFTRNRLVIESSYFGLSGSQWAGLAFAVGGTVWLLRMRRRAAEPEAEPRAEAEMVPVPEGVPAAMPLAAAEQRLGAPESPPSADAPPASMPSPPVAPPPMPESVSAADSAAGRGPEAQPDGVPAGPAQPAAGPAIPDPAAPPERGPAPEPPVPQTGSAEPLRDGSSSSVETTDADEEEPPPPPPAPPPPPSSG